MLSRFHIPLASHSFGGNFLWNVNGVWCLCKNESNALNWSFLLPNENWLLELASSRHIFLENISNLLRVCTTYVIWITGANNAMNVMKYGQTEAMNFFLFRNFGKMAREHRHGGGIALVIANILIHSVSTFFVNSIDAILKFNERHSANKRTFFDVWKNFMQWHVLNASILFLSRFSIVAKGHDIEKPQTNGQYTRIYWWLFPVFASILAGACMILRGAAIIVCVCVCDRDKISLIKIGIFEKSSLSLALYGIGIRLLVWDGIW